MNNDKIFRIAGFIIIGIAAIGFMTVADEFRHMGELIGVSGVLISGIFLVAAGYQEFAEQPILRSAMVAWSVSELGSSLELQLTIWYPASLVAF